MASWICRHGNRFGFPRTWLLVLLLGSGLALPAGAGANSQFVDVTVGALGETGNTFGVAWGDYDNDGDEDLYLCNTTTPNKLLRNDGNDVFVDVTSGPLGDTGSGFGVAWADYDNDGDLDLFLVNDFNNALLRNDGSGVFVDVANPALKDPGSSGQGVGWADYDDDGDLDLYVTNFGDPNKLFRNEGYANFVVATPAGLAVGGDGTGVAWADYDADGDLDLYTSATAGARLFRNESPGVFNDITSDTTGIQGSTGVAWGDYDNDGDLDLYVGRELAENTLLRNESNSRFVEIFSDPLRDAGSAGSVAWADFDNDSDLDLFLGNFDDTNELFRNEGFGIFVETGTPAMDNAGNIRGAAWADYDGDGDLDLYMGVVNGPNKLFRNDTVTGNHWYHVKLLSPGPNRDAIGGRVRLVAGGVQQIREVEGGSGLYSQNSLCLEFGLGPAANIALLQVTWPDGQVDSVSVNGVDRKRIVVKRNLSTVGVEDTGSRFIGLLANHPNPFRGSTRIRYDLSAPAPVDIRIFDVSGRVVRVLESGRTRPEGAHELNWDGRNDRGHSVPPGVYLYRVRAGKHQAASKMILSP